MQGNKTHEQQLRILEKKDDVPKPGDPNTPPAPAVKQADPGERESEFPVSRGGLNQESRDHNKHNHPGQSGHGPQKHSPAEEKH